MKQSADLAPGTRLGRYVISRCIGAGGMGAVYEGRHADLDKKVAVKVLLPQLAATAEVRTRFLREGEAASRIRHPNVVDVYDVGSEGDLTYLVMEFLEGEDLGQLLKRDYVLAPQRIANIFLPACAGLWRAHQCGVIHRDIKPANIFLAKGAYGEEVPKLLDFGISKVASNEPAQGLTMSGMLLGTPFYMSPEQAQGDRLLDARSDQYSVGVILYQCSTGTRPFEADSMYKMLHKIVQGEFESPRARAPTIPEDFERVVLKAMATKPEDRYPDIGALARDLLPFAGTRARAMWSQVFGDESPSSDLEVKDPAPAPEPVVTTARRASASLPALDARGVLQERLGVSKSGTAPSMASGAAISSSSLPKEISAVSNPSLLRDPAMTPSVTFAGPHTIAQDQRRQKIWPLAISLVILIGAAGTLVYALSPSADKMVRAEKIVRPETPPAIGVGLNPGTAGKAEVAPTAPLPTEGTEATRATEATAPAEVAAPTSGTKSPPSSTTTNRTEKSASSGSTDKRAGTDKPGNTEKRGRAERPARPKPIETTEESATQGSNRAEEPPKIKRGANDAPIIR